MSFQVSRSDIQFVNRALSLIMEEPLPSLASEITGLAARTARMWYKPVVAGLLERWHWNLATKRAPLAAIANTRSSEYSYAYALPADCAYPKMLVMPNGGQQPYYGQLRSLMLRGRFERVGRTMYSHTAMAALDYTSYDVTEQDFDEEFSDVVVLSLAAAFAMPITKKPSIADKYREAANTALDLAIARDRNINEPTYGTTPTETELVRGVGIGDPLWTGNWGYDPAGIS